MLSNFSKFGARPADGKHAMESYKIRIYSGKRRQNKKLTEPESKRGRGRYIEREREKGKEYVFVT